MIQLGDTGIWLGSMAYLGWRPAVASFRDGRLPLDRPDEEMMWRAAGVVDADGEVREGWRKALACGREAIAGAYVVARQGNLALITNIGVSRDAIVTTSSRSLLADDLRTIEVQEPTVEVCVGDRSTLWTLLRRVLPRRNALRSGEDPTAVVPATGLPTEPEDSIVTMALGRAGEPRVATLAWFTHDDLLHRLDDKGLWQAYPGDLRHTAVLTLERLAA